MKSQKNKLKDLVFLTLYGVIIFISYWIMQALPNIHIVGALIVCLTAVYRTKALISIYIYVFLAGLFGGFSPWWVGYLYVWAVLWALVMVIPKKPLFAVIAAGLHGITFGILFSPSQALLFGYDFNQMLMWIASGFPLDVIHCISNVISTSLLFVPITWVLKKASSL